MSAGERRVRRASTVAAALHAAVWSSVAFAQPAPTAVLTPADTVCMEGTVGNGRSVRRAVLALEREAGRWSGGALDVHGRPLRTIAVRVLGAGGDTLHAVSADSTQRAAVRLSVAVGENEASGILVSAGDTVGVRLRAVNRSAAHTWSHGDWVGIVQMGGMPVRLGAQLRAGRCGLLYATLDSPDQGQNGLPVTAVRTTADSVVLEAAYLDLRLAMARGEGEGEERWAMLVQRGVEERLRLQRGVRASESRRPQDPVRPFPYVEREVAFTNAGVRFGATVTVPPGAGPFPGLVLLSGSGSQDRDETVAGHRPFLVLSDYLTRLGFAVLRFDDRGAGGTPGSMLQTTLDDLAGDASAALSALRAQPEVDGSRVGLIGHSEGGYVAPMVAARDTLVRFVVLLAAPAARGRNLLMAQRIALMRAEGAAQSEIVIDSLMWTRLFALFDTRPPNDQLEDLAARALQQWLAALPAESRVAAEATLTQRSAAQDSASLMLWRSAWYRSLYHHDPAPVLRQLRVPLLAIWGDLDLQVPPAQSEPALRAALHPTMAGSLTVARFPGVNHMLQRARTGLISEYIEIEETIAPGVLERIGTWLDQMSRPGAR